MMVHPYFHQHYSLVHIQHQQRKQRQVEDPNGCWQRILRRIRYSREGDDDGGGMNHGLLRPVTRSPQMFSDDGDLDEISTPESVSRLVLCRHEIIS